MPIIFQRAYNTLLMELCSSSRRTSMTAARITIAAERGGHGHHVRITHSLYSGQETRYSVMNCSFIQRLFFGEGTEWGDHTLNEVTPYLDDREDHGRGRTRRAWAPPSSSRVRARLYRSSAKVRPLDEHAHVRCAPTPARALSTVGGSTQC